MTNFPELDEHVLDHVCGGADDPLGPTVLVAGRPQTCQAVVARGKELIARGNDPTISNQTWLREWRRLDDAYMKFPKAC